MILEFKFKNFRSAKDWQILSFEASADKVSEEYYCTTINDTKVSLIPQHFDLTLFISS